jgi:hypothetical protein
MIMIEYIAIKGINLSVEEAHKLGALLVGIVVVCAYFAIFIGRCQIVLHLFACRTHHFTLLGGAQCAGELDSLQTHRGWRMNICLRVAHIISLKIMLL